MPSLAEKSREHYHPGDCPKHCSADEPSTGSGPTVCLITQTPDSHDIRSTLSRFSATPKKHHEGAMVPEPVEQIQKETLDSTATVPYAYMLGLQGCQSAQGCHCSALAGMIILKFALRPGLDINAHMHLY